MPTQAASKVPRPRGIGPSVAAIDAVMKLTNATQIVEASPKARDASHDATASSTRELDKYGFGAQDRITQKISWRLRDCQ
jgi:hypothetical protein